MSTIFWVRVDIRFVEPLDLTVGKSKREYSGVVHGFFQEFGVTALDEIAMNDAVVSRVAKEELKSKTEYRIEWEFVGVIQPEEVDREVHGDRDIADVLIGDPRSDGFWYASGRTYYTDDTNG